MAQDPLYSVIIPTRERHDVFEPCLKTAVSQTASNYEVIVMDNQSGPATKNVVDRIGNDKVVYVRAPERLSMSKNWELGLSHAKGDFVFFLGDDDALFRDTIETATWIHRRHPGKIISWKRVMWWWPKVVIPEYRNLLQFHLSNRVEIRSSRDSLQQLYRGECYYADLPGVYNAFIPRGLVDETVERFGAYFLSEIPDVSSAIVNSYSTEKHLFSYRPLALAAGSHHSTGISQTFRHFGNKSADTFDKENAGTWDSEFDASINMGGGYTLELIIANVLLKAKTLIFPEDDGIQFSYEGLVNQMCRSMANYAGDYERVAELTRTIARRNGISEEQYAIPGKKELPVVIKPYRIRRDAHRVEQALFTSRDLVTDARKAARYLQSMLCNKEKLKFVSATGQQGY